MRTRLALAAALCMLLAGSVHAQSRETPKDSDECLKVAFDLSQAAEEKQLSDDKLDKLEEMLTQMETYCDANQFTQAMTVASDIQAVIDGK